MKTRDMFFGILIVVAGLDIFVMVLLGSIGMKEGMGRTLLDAFLLSLLGAPLIYLFVVKEGSRRLSGRAVLSRKVPEKEIGRNPSLEKQERGSPLLSLINNVPGMVYRGHRDWSLSFIGAEVESVTGYTSGEFMSGAVCWKAIIHPDDQERLKKSIRAAVKDQRKTLRVEYRILCKNGSIRWVADRRQMFYDETGSFAYVDGLILDITERKRADLRLAESEFRFRSIANTSPNGMVTVDAAGNIDFFNCTAEKQFGYASDEVIGKNVTMLIPERYRRDHEAGLERFLKTGEHRIIGSTVELEALRKDGTEFPIELSLGTWGEKDAPFFSAIIRDITERTVWERSLKESEEKFRVIFEGSKDGILLADLEHKRFVAGNQAICDMLQYSREELGQLGVADIHPEEDLPRAIDTFERQARQEYELATNIPVKRKDGTTLFANIKATPVTISGKKFLMGNFRDVTERRKAEEALDRLAMAVGQAAEAVVITDTEGKIEYVNPAFERITGYSQEESVGRNMRILKSGKHDEMFYNKMWETISRGEVWSGQFQNRKKDGTLYEEDAVISPVRSVDGKIINFVAGKKDITRDLALQKQVQTAQRMESVGTLAGGIAHDFNNALTGILGYSEMLRMRLADDRKSLADLDEISRASERAAALTRQLLTFARRQVVDPVNLDIGDVVKDLLKFFTKVAGAQVEVKSLRAADTPTVRVDPGQIEQVLMNLLLNARDAMPGGGQLLVETAAADLGEEFIRSYPYMKAGRYALLLVSDTGTGMDEATRERVFEPFFTTKATEKGTGLGLSVVYGIVKQHNGFIHVYSEPGKGSTFKVYLPAVEAPPDARVPVKAGQIRGGSETILLAEDEESVRGLAERILNNLGYEVLAARNGEEAVDLFRKYGDKIALAVLDVVMPRMGGKEALDAIRKENPGLKAIFMSGYSADTIHEAFVIRPDIPFLGKPFSSAALARKVREVLDGERGSA